MEASENQRPNRFNVRVYGLLKNATQEQVLISKEVYQGLALTKFPGGGLEFGEGVTDALIREFQEELGIDIQPIQLLYINDFLQISAFNPLDQLLAIYYEVVPTSPLPAGFPNHQAHLEGQKFQWVSLKTLEQVRFSFPVDKVVAAMVAGEASGSD